MSIVCKRVNLLTLGEQSASINSVANSDFIVGAVATLVTGSIVAVLGHFFALHREHNSRKHVALRERLEEARSALAMYEGYAEDVYPIQNGQEVVDVESRLANLFGEAFAAKAILPLVHDGPSDAAPKAIVQIKAHIEELERKVGYPARPKLRLDV